MASRAVESTFALTAARHWLADHPDAVLYLAAYKYTPNGEMDVSELEDSYDQEVWEADDLGGLSSVSYSLVAPSNTVIYLWAGFDLDANGLLNELEEPFTPYEDGAGYATGESSTSEIDFLMMYSAEEEEEGE